METKVSDLMKLIDERIDLQLTEEILSKLAFKGISPTQARDYLRVKALRAVNKEAQNA